ncbi:molybdenum cofactor guanylyltransferase [Salinigranum rubrum]|uniref:Probable molybdenum cofactor guanylyltransferase n=1 Tax=Salinigranum rubrum TaxID=755307 RepID=A0A2I8VFM0_9EURY|nr:molybdenum cofactor guanylyltransferase [Salinigranum rubrum]AUV80732.1 molybdenum cofactor guanylyltransferase [Salinigranum rubrum]
MRSGVIVAGGRSTRFGDRDKAVADLAGMPMIRRVADRVARACDRLVVNCRADQRDAIDAALAGADPTFAVDADPDRGPVAGIRTGLRAVETEYAAVVACDMPFVDPDFLAYLFERAAGHDAAVPRPGEFDEPLQAVYRATAMADACDDALAASEGREPRVLTPIETLDRVVVRGDEVFAHAASDTFENLNTESEFRAANERLRGQE